MWQNNRKILICAVLAISLLLTVPSVQAQEDILDKIPDAKPAETFQVVMSTVSNNATSTLEILYPKQQTVYYESSAVFEKYLVSIGDEVKAGDVLAQFRKEKDEVKFARLELALDKAKQAMSEGVRQRQERLDRLRSDLELISDPYEKELAELTLEYYETELEQYRYQQQKNVDRQRTALDEANADLNDIELIAPIDGYVSDVTRYSQGDYVSSGSFFVNIQQRDVQLLSIPKKAAAFSLLRYNLPVSISFQSKQLTGRVIYAGDAIPLAGKTDAVYIELDREHSDIQLRYASMTCDLMGLGNIAIIPRDFLKIDRNGNTFVYLSVDGKSQRRYVQCLYQDSDYAVIPMGLSEGDILSMY